jgi:hypothetical protein
VLLVSYVAGQQPSAGDVERLTEHSAFRLAAPRA